MNDFESRLTQMLRERSNDVDDSSVPAGRVVRRARRRRVLTIATVATALVAVAFSGVAVSMMGDEISRDVAGPANTTPYAGGPGRFDTTDDPSTKRIEVATGERSGLPWTLYMYREDVSHGDSASREMWCLGFAWDGDGGGCPVALRDGEYVSLSQSGSDVNPEDSLTGRIDREVARVEIRIQGSAPFEAPIIPGPPLDPSEDDPQVDFFVAFIPASSTGEVVVFDEAGKELQAQEFLDYEEDFDDDEIEDPKNEGPRCIGSPATIEGTDGPDALEGTDGRDVIAGLGGDDTILGLGGGDILCGGDGNDAVEGGAGDDEVSGGLGDDDLDGGDGFDFLSFSEATSGVDVDLAAGTSTGQGTDRVTGFDSIWGTPFDDRLAGTDGADQLEAEGGDDVIEARGGDDVLYGGLGDDDYVGGDGEDLVSFSISDAPVVVDLLGGTVTGEGRDTIAEVEIVDGSRFDDRITGGAGDDLLIGREGDDTLAGGSGDDVLWGEFSRLTAASYRAGGNLIAHIDDLLVGGDGVDELHGGPGANTCSEGERVEDC